MEVSRYIEMLYSIDISIFMRWIVEESNRRDELYLVESHVDMSQ